MSEEQTPFAAAESTPSPEVAPVIADPQAVASPTPIVIPDAVKHLVGEGKKYATLDLALAALEPAQQHIDITTVVILPEQQYFPDPVDAINLQRIIPERIAIVYVLFHRLPLWYRPARQGIMRRHD